jgi:putative transposase
MCAFNKREYFVDAGNVALVRDRFLRTAAMAGVEILAYCFMPDHLHALLEGTHSTADLNRCATTFRQQSGYEYKKLYGARLWQDGYFDRVLRNEETTGEVVRYILANPVRAGLCTDPAKYPFAGSSRHALNDLVESVRFVDSASLG